MVDLEKIKRSVADVCKEIDSAFIQLSDRAGERKEVEKQIDTLKEEIEVLRERKVNIAQSVNNEQAAAAEKMTEHTDIKVKYRKMINEEKIAHQKELASFQAEMDSLRSRELSLLKSQKLKMVNETELAIQARDEVRKEYLEIKTVITNLKNGITI